MVMVLPETDVVDPAIFTVHWLFDNVPAAGLISTPDRGPSHPVPAGSSMSRMP